MTFEDGIDSPPLARGLVRSLLSDAEKPVLAIAVGDTIEAQYKLGSTWYVAKVVAIKDDCSAYDVQYSDGDLEANLGAAFVRSISKAVSPPFQVGEAIELAQETEWLEATVTRLSQTKDGQFEYDVTILESGRTVNAVEAPQIRKMTGEVLTAV